MIDVADIDLALVKQHCRVYHDEDDAIIQSYIVASVSAVNRDLEKDWGWIEAKYDSIPPELLLLVSLRVATIYEHRADVSEFERFEVPMSYKMIRDLYRTPTF